MKVLKRNKQLERFNINKILKAVEAAYKSTNKEVDLDVMYELKCFPESLRGDVISVETIQDEVEKVLMDMAPYEVARAYIVYREEHKAIRKYAQDKIDFINNYKKSDNTANATVDDNSNVRGKNIGILNSEIHKKDNIQISRRMVVEKLRELYPEFNAKQYIKDLDNHVIYKHDESSFSGAIAPYCCSISMYPFLTEGIKNIGGLSAAPKNIDSFCGMYVNLIFATSAMFAGACLYKDQELLIQENGIAYKRRIKDLVANHLNKPLSFSNYQGDWEYAVCDNLKVLEDGKLVDITKVYRRKYKDKIYKITTKDGHTAQVSKDHIFKQLIQGRVLDIKAEQLKELDTVIMNKDYSSIINFKNKEFKKGWIIGMICGDGCLTKESTVALSVNYEQEYLGEIFNAYLKEIYGYELHKNKGHGCWNYTKRNQALLDLIHEDIIGSTAYDKHINLQNKSLDYIAGFLDGLFCADGSYSESHGITISLTNKELATNVHDALNYFDLNSHICTIAPKGNRKESYSQYVSSKILKYLCHIHKKVLKRGTLAESNQEIILNTDVIDSIEVLDNDDDYVYEIETTSHWYNCGGFITHNCATSEFLLYFTYFCKKEWGNEFYLKPDIVISTPLSYRKKTIRSQIHQYWQQVVYSINQPAAARGLQSAFVNFTYFDKAFFEGMFGDFYFPDGTKPDWPSLNWIQREFMQWFNQERLWTMLPFPVESFALVYKHGEFVDLDSAKFVAKEYARGHSFFTYISDTVDSLSSCCFSKDTKVLWKNSFDGVKCTTLEELHNTKWEPDKKNLRIFHNGSWVKGKSIKLPNREMFKITTYNNKEFIMSDNHINITYDGEKSTKELTTEDYLMFNTSILHPITENNEHLTYEQGLLVGLFIGDGTFGNYVCQDGSVHNFQLSLNENKWNKVKDILSTLGEFKLGTIHNNVYTINCCNKELTTFISKWTTNEPNQTTALNKSLNLNCLTQSIEFRRGILDGWYITDGGNSNRCYTVSKQLVENMEILCTSLGLQTIIDISDRTDESVIIRGYNRNYPLYCLRWYVEDNHRTNKTTIKTWKKKNNSIYWKIKSIEPIDYKDDIYCIQCNNEDEPYFTLPCGLITHNCRLKNMITTKEFNFTNGNMGIQTGSKSVITLNLNRIIQDYFGQCKHEEVVKKNYWNDTVTQEKFVVYLKSILSRVYKYHNAYNALLWDMYDNNLLPVYKAGFIDLNKQYLTVGLNGLNQAAEFVGLECNDNEEYSKFCQLIFSTIKEENLKHKTKTTIFNTEQVPAESLAVKNYNCDKEDGYWVPEDTNLYASYIFKPNDPNVTVLDKLKLHGSNYIGDYLDGGWLSWASYL